jgi:IgA Peptidase M64
VAHADAYRKLTDATSSSLSLFASRAFLSEKTDQHGSGGSRDRSFSSSSSRIGQPAAQQQQPQQQQQQHRRLQTSFFGDILSFFLNLFTFSFKTCRSIGDGNYETREGLDLISYFIGITIQGEKSGACTCTVDCDAGGGGGGVGNGAVGQVCNTDNDCTNPFVCKSRVCLASSDCNILKHQEGDPFTTDRITLVFVGSAFTNDQSFIDAVVNNYNTMKTFEYFAEDIPMLNVMYVLPSEGQKTGYCFQPCGGIDRLLCCNTNDAKSLSSRCFSSNDNVQTLVLHNNVTYGGAGYPGANVATASLASIGPKILVHELGHSLFELGDEYVEGSATSSFSANCADAGCSKWSDLIGRSIAGYNPVGCISGVCERGLYHVGEKSIMDQLTLQPGAVNARFACCAYLSLTKSTPAYCRKFDFTPGALLAYCRDNDYQNLGEETYALTQGRVVVESTVFSIAIAAASSSNLNPLITITREAVVRRPVANRGIVFFPSLAAAAPGRVIVLEYKLARAKSSTRLFVSATTTVSVPLSSSGGADFSLTTPDSVRLDTNFIQIVVEANVADVEYATAELVVIQ